jgi:hypothetical protein
MMLHAAITLMLEPKREGMRQLHHAVAAFTC